MKTKTLIIAGAALGFACTLAQAQVTAERNGAMTNAEGRTLYTFDKDSKGVSVCNGTCAAIWPPFVAGSDAKNHERMTIIARADGSRQWAFDGKPLYFFAADQKPGDMNGDGEGGVWHIVKQKSEKASRAGGYSYGGYGDGNGRVSSSNSSYYYSN